MFFTSEVEDSGLVIRSHLFGAMLSRDETFDSIVRHAHALQLEWALPLFERSISTSGSLRKSSESLSTDENGANITPLPSSAGEGLNTAGTTHYFI